MQAESRKPQVLYVDDEPQNLSTFRAAFRRYYKVYVARSGEEAIALLDDQPVDLIITDQRMPGMTGVELFERILEKFPDPVRMVLTGYSDMSAIVDAINKGKIYYYVPKPWKQEELKLIIDNALEAYFLKLENRALSAERNALQLAAERQQKEQLLSQFEMLKDQLNPHFLFNCLNALASLVHDQPERAEAFITKMTKVYRYLLVQNEDALVPLEQELSFLEDYFFLQQTRFGENLQLQVEVAASQKDLMVPPLTLQLLVENAVKHNIISRLNPLRIEVATEAGNWLKVRNNLQRRREPVDSTGLGLKNLCARYKLLTDEEPNFQETADEYVARVPLLA